MILTGVEFKLDDSQPIAPPVEAPKTNLEDYVGKYKMTGLPFDFIEISVKEGKVIMNAGTQGGPINPTDTPDKYDADGKATLYFVRDESKKVTSIKMQAMGFTFEGKKQ
jgi:cytochrome c